MPSSKMLEGYCADVEHLLREGALREAIRLAVVLPEICSALESVRLRSSHEDYARWCESWLELDRRGRKRITGARVYRLHAIHASPSESRRTSDPSPKAMIGLRKRRYIRDHLALSRARVWQPQWPLETFQVSLCEALVAAARRWYAEHGREDPIVQGNLGRLAVR